MRTSFTVGDEVKIPVAYTVEEVDARMNPHRPLYKLSNGSWYFADEIEKISQTGGKK